MSRASAGSAPANSAARNTCPPGAAFSSTTSTESPHSRAVIAAAMPAGPAPIMARSNLRGASAAFTGTRLIAAPHARLAGGRSACRLQQAPCRLADWPRHQFRPCNQSKRPSCTKACVGCLRPAFRGWKKDPRSEWRRRHCCLPAPSGRGLQQKPARFPADDRGACETSEAFSRKRRQERIKRAARNHRGQ